MNREKIVEYRPERDILHINLGRNSHESLPRGGFILDLDREGRVVGVEILDTSEILASLDVPDVDAFLENLVDGDAIVKEKMGLTWVILKLYAIIDEQEIEKTFRLEVPAGENQAQGEIA